MLWDMLAVKACGAPLLLLQQERALQALARPRAGQAAVNELCVRLFCGQMADRHVVPDEAEAGFLRALGEDAVCQPCPPGLSDGLEIGLKEGARSGVVWIGRAGAGFTELLDALKILRRVAEMAPEVKCTLVGLEPDAGNELAARDFIREAGLEDRLFWAEPQADLQACLQRAACCLLTSRAAPLSAVVAKAQACGAPLVSYAAPGLGELTPVQGCWIVPAGDIEAAARALARTASDEGLAASMSRLARASFQSRFDPAGVSSRLKAIIEECEKPDERAWRSAPGLDGFLASILAAMRAGLEEPAREAELAGFRKEPEKTYDCEDFPMHLKWHVLRRIHPRKSKRRHYRWKLQACAPGFDQCRHDVEDVLKQRILRRRKTIPDQAAQRAARALQVLKRRLLGAPGASAGC